MVSLRGDWWPKTRIGRMAVWFSLAAIIWGLSPMILYWLVMAGVFSSAPPISGVLLLVVEFILAISALALSINAIFKQKERNIASILTFAFLCLTGGFWTFFLIGEFLFPH